MKTNSPSWITLHYDAPDGRFLTHWSPSKSHLLLPPSFITKRYMLLIYILGCRGCTCTWQRHPRDPQGNTAKLNTLFSSRLWSDYYFFGYRCKEGRRFVLEVSLSLGELCQLVTFLYKSFHLAMFVMVI